VSNEINIEGAERTLSVLGICIAVGYVGLVLSLVLISWLGGPPGEKGPFDSWISLLSLVSILALLLSDPDWHSGGKDWKERDYLGRPILRLLTVRATGRLLQDQVSRRRSSLRCRSSTLRTSDVKIAMHAQRFLHVVPNKPIHTTRENARA
jgi:hypothetical protein